MVCPSLVSIFVVSNKRLLLNSVPVGLNWVPSIPSGIFRSSFLDELVVIIMLMTSSRILVPSYSLMHRCRSLGWWSGCSYERRYQHPLQVYALLVCPFPYPPFTRYSLMFKSHITGTPVARTLFMSFPEDQNTFYVDDQMMWDTSLLINPVLQPNVTSIHSYFPAGTWYNYYTNEHFESQGQYRDDPVTLDFMPLYVYGGSILVSQEPKLNVPETRKTNMTINVYMDKDFVAKGEFYYDDGITLGMFLPILLIVFRHLWEQAIHPRSHGAQQAKVLCHCWCRQVCPCFDSLILSLATRIFLLWMKFASMALLQSHPLSSWTRSQSNQSMGFYRCSYVFSFEDGVVIFRDINCNFFDGITIQWRY